MEVVFASLLLLALIGLAASLRVVPEGRACTVYRLGRYRRTLQTGVHFTLPLFDRVACKVDLRGRSLDVNVADLSGPDGHVCAATGRVYYQVVDPVAAEPEADHPEQVILNATLIALRAIPPQILGLERGEEFNRSVRQAVNESLRGHGMMVVRYQLELRNAA